MKKNKRIKIIGIALFLIGASGGILGYIIKNDWKMALMGTFLMILGILMGLKYELKELSNKIEKK